MYIISYIITVGRFIYKLLYVRNVQIEKSQGTMFTYFYEKFSLTKIVILRSIP